MSSTKVYGVPVTSQITGVTKMVRPVQYRQPVTPQQGITAMSSQQGTNQLIYPPPPQYPNPPDIDLTPPMPKSIDETNNGEVNDENETMPSTKLSKTQLTASMPNMQTVENVVIRQTSDAKTIVSEVKRNLEILLTNDQIQDKESRLLLEISKKQLDLLTIILNKQ